MAGRADTGEVDTWLSLTSAAILLVGFASGVLSGMFGVGGAVLTTPGIRVLGASPVESVGSTVPAILPGAISGTYRYAKAKVVNWRIGIVCGVSGALFAFGGAKVVDFVNAHYLMILTAALLGWSGVNILRAGRHAGMDADADRVADAGAEDDPGSSTATVPARGGGAADAYAADEGAADELAVALREPVADDRDPKEISTLVLALVGAASGFLAGLLGVGGGVIMMPIFTNVLKIPVKVAVASSLVAVAIFSASALVMHARLGHINWHYAILLTIGVVPGAQVGSRLTIGASDRTVRLMFGCFLVVLATIYGAGELLALRG